jgi:predicted 3-demethylubiquinone-9 3-methyltransferase (glyoxalase superfamily)
MHKITPFLWFDGRAEEAMNFYTGIFKNAKVGEIRRWGEGAPAPKGSVLSASFEIEGQPLIAFNGGPHFTFTPAVSLMVDCKTQDEVDHYWNKLGEGGTESQCGWLQDQFGLSWQIVPSRLGELLQDPDPARAGRAMQAMLKMKKLDIAALELAAAG